MTVLSLVSKSLKDLQSNHFRRIFEKQMYKPVRNNRNQDSQQRLEMRIQQFSPLVCSSETGKHCILQVHKSLNLTAALRLKTNTTSSAVYTEH